MSNEETRARLAKQIIEICLFVADLDQRTGGAVTPDAVANLSLKQIVERLGVLEKAEAYVADAMAMMLSCTYAVHQAGGAVRAVDTTADFHEMVTKLASNGIRFHYEKPETDRTML